MKREIIQWKSKAFSALAFMAFAIAFFAPQAAFAVCDTGDHEAWVEESGCTGCACCSNAPAMSDCSGDWLVGCIGDTGSCDTSFPGWVLCSYTSTAPPTWTNCASTTCTSDYYCRDEDRRGQRKSEGSCNYTGSDYECASGTLMDPSSDANWCNLGSWCDADVSSGDNTNSATCNSGDSVKIKQEYYCDTSYPTVAPSSQYGDCGMRDKDPTEYTVVDYCNNDDQASSEWYCDSTSTRANVQQDEICSSGACVMQDEAGPVYVNSMTWCTGDVPEGSNPNPGVCNGGDVAKIAQEYLCDTSYPTQAPASDPGDCGTQDKSPTEYQITDYCNNDDQPSSTWYCSDTHEKAQRQQDEVCSGGACVMQDESPVVYVNNTAACAGESYTTEFFCEGGGGHDDYSSNKVTEEYCVVGTVDPDNNCETQVKNPVEYVNRTQCNGTRTTTDWTCVDSDTKGQANEQETCNNTTGVCEWEDAGTYGTTEDCITNNECTAMNYYCQNSCTECSNDGGTETCDSSSCSTGECCICTGGTESCTDCSGDYDCNDSPDHCAFCDPDGEGGTLKFKGDRCNSSSCSANYVYYTESCSSGACCDVGTQYCDGITSCNATCQVLAIVTDFKAYKQAGGVAIRWETAAESQNRGFNIYKTTDIEDPEELGEPLNASLIPGLHHSPSGERYEFIDPAGGEGDKYVLEWIDYSGKTFYRGEVAAKRVPLPRLEKKQWTLERLRESLRAERQALTPHKLTVAKANRLMAMNHGVANRRARIEGENLGVRIEVKKDGLYEVSLGEIRDALGVDFTTATAGELALTHMGQAYPMMLSSAGALSETDTIGFFGEKNTGRHTATNVYHLMRASESHREMALVDASALDGARFQTTHRYQLHVNENYWYAHQGGSTDGGYWEWLWTGMPEPFSATFTADNIAQGQETIEFSAVLAAMTENAEVADAHIYEAVLNGNKIGDIRWSGAGYYRYTAEIPAEWLNEGENTITLRYRNPAQAPKDFYDLVALDGFTFTYTRELKPISGELFFQTHCAQPNLKIKGFQSDDVMVFDITNDAEPKRLGAVEIVHGDGGYEAKLRCVQSGEPNGMVRLFATTQASINPPFDISLRLASDIRDTTNQADLLIIAYDAFAPELASLVEHRRQQGLSVKIVTMSEIADEFDNGRLSDFAIKDFLIYAANNWAEPAPSNVLIVGDALDDPNNVLELDGINFVPTHFFEDVNWSATSSDSWFADIDYDGDFEMAIGRLSVDSVEEVQAAVGKLIAFETANQSEPLPGYDRILLIADKPLNPMEDFSFYIDEIASGIPDGYDVVKIKMENYDDPSTQGRQAVLSRLSEGAALVIYAGHSGGMNIGSDSALRSEDIANLPTGVHKPFFISMSCISGMFAYPGKEFMAEALITPQHKGAIAALMPTDLSAVPAFQKIVLKMLRQLFCEESANVGDALTLALNDFVREYGDGVSEVRSAMTLAYLGDPLLDLDLPFTFEQCSDEPVVDGDIDEFEDEEDGTVVVVDGDEEEAEEEEMIDEPQIDGDEQTGEADLTQEAEEPTVTEDGDEANQPEAETTGGGGGGGCRNGGQASAFSLLFLLLLALPLLYRRKKLGQS